MKRLLIVVALCASACGGSSSAPTNPAPPAPTPPAPTPTNTAPVISTLTVTPTFGIGGLTPFTISAQASDSDGDPVSYGWVVSDFRGPIASFSGSSVIRPDFTGPNYGVTAKLTVADGRGGVATRTSTTFVIGSMATDWVVLSPTFPNTTLFYLRLSQDRAGLVTGTILNALEAPLGRTEVGNPGRIDGLGNLSGLRLKFDNGADVTIAGQMQTDGEHVVGSFVAASALFRGVSLARQPMTLEVD